MELRHALVFLPLPLAAACSGASTGRAASAAPGFFAPTIVNETGDPIEVEVSPSRFIVDCGATSHLGDALRASAFVKESKRTSLSAGGEMTLPDAPMGPFPNGDCPAYRVRARMPSGGSLDRVVLFPPAWKSDEHRRRLALRKKQRFELESCASSSYDVPGIAPTRDGELPACKGPLPSRLPRWLAPLPDPSVAWTISEQRPHAGGCLDLDLSPKDTSNAAPVFWAVCVPEGGWPFSKGETIRIQSGYQLHSSLVAVPGGFGLVEPHGPEHVERVRIERADPPLLRVELERNGVPGGGVNLDGALCVAIRESCENIWLEGTASMGPLQMRFPEQASATFPSRDGTQETLLPAEYRWLLAAADRCSPAGGSDMTPGAWSGHVSIHRPGLAVAK